MFCLTVSHGNTPYSWKMTPRSGPGPLTGRPSRSTRPSVGATNPATMFIIVVLPHPDGPMTATKSPSPIAYDTSSTTRSRPCFDANSIDTWSKTMRGPVVIMRGLRPSRSRYALLPRDEAARNGAQHEVHGERDQPDADDADVDDVELEERRRVLDQRAQPLLRGDELGCHERRPRDAERHAQRGQQVRHRERHDHLAEDFRVARAERLRHPHVDRADLRNAFVHHDHAGEERRVEQHDDLRDLPDAEIDDHERNQRDRR